eukprot:gene12852-14805_t
MSRPWWNDAALKEELTQRADSGRWYVIARPTPSSVLPARVVRVIYAGYKVVSPDGIESNVNPEKPLTEIVLSEGEDINDHPEYQAALKEYEEEQRVKKQAADEDRRQKEELLEQQRTCLHSDSPSGLVEEVARGAGCDVYYYSCPRCLKHLRTSYATAYDRDPDDEITDWDWWVRFFQKQYNGTPRRENYRIISVGPLP